MDATAAKKKECFLTISFNNNCMFRCKMCQMWKEKDRFSTEISAAGFKNIVQSLKSIDEYNFKGITFAGGEALVELEILDLVNVAACEGFFTAISSNGYLIDEEMARRISFSGLNSINLSLDSCNPQTHDFLRGVKGSYQRVIKAVENLAKFCNKMSIGICTVITQSNLDDLVDLIEWVKQDNRIDGIAFQAIVQPFNTKRDGEWYAKDENSLLWPKDLEKTWAIIDNLIDMKKTGNFKIRNPISQFKIFKSYFANPQNFIKRKTCNIGEKALTVNESGEVSFCYIFGPVGNIKECSLKDILFSEAAEKMRMKMDSCRENCNLLVNCFFENDQDEAALSPIT